LGNRDLEAARTYHEVTKHSYTSVRSSPHALDWSNRPLPYKIYPEAGVFALPRDLNLAGVPAIAAARGDFAIADDTPLDLERLTRLLFCTGGLTRRARVGAEEYHFRAAASAGALYPIEMYLAASEVEGLEPGLYHFSPADLRLRGLRRGDWRSYLAHAAAMRPDLREARAVLVMSALFWRSAWKYRARAYRYCFWDAGTMLANLLAAANAEALKAEVVTGFEDESVERLLDVDGEREGIMCIVALGRTAAGADESPELKPLGLDTIPLSQAEVRYDDLTRLHRESALISADEVRAVASPPPDSASPPAAASTIVDSITPSPLPHDAGTGLGETILRRGSTRAFAREEIGADELAGIMAASGALLDDDLGELAEAYLIVNAVAGLEPGAYYYRSDGGAFELIREGDFRNQAGYLCLEQPLGADCSALIVYMENLERALRRYGNRGYRNAHLAAGVRGGRAYLAAYALARGASGLTFYDDDTTAFFGPHAAGKIPLLMVAIGVPYRRQSEP
jgi:SagB-type dehydrogenase family enzyme